MDQKNRPIDGSLVGFFADVLPSPIEGEVFVACSLKTNPHTKARAPMWHSYAATHDELAAQILVTSNDGKDKYFALARYKPHTTAKGYPGRQAAHATSVKAFWFDLDCGEQKSATGEGYLTQKDAVVALVKFLTDCELPEPTYMVNSGGGIHVYFALTEPISSAMWKLTAEKLKMLTAVRRFLADPSRTADIASVLRPPGTINCKIDTPRPVEIKRSGKNIQFEVFNEAIEHALADIGSVPAFITLPPEYLPVVEGNLSAPDYGPPDLVKLESALAMLDPDCEEPTWKLQRIAPLARAAKEYSDLHDQLKELARRWSRGDLFSGGVK